MISSGMISNILGKSLIIPRIGSYALGATAAHKLACFGYRTVSYIASPATESALGQKVAKNAKHLGFYPHSKDDSDTSKIKLLKQAVAIGVIACLLHDMTFYFQGKGSKIYNTLFSLTPMRILETSCLDSVKETIRSFSPRKLSTAV